MGRLMDGVGFGLGGWSSGWVDGVVFWPASAHYAAGASAHYAAGAARETTTPARGQELQDRSRPVCALDQWLKASVRARPMAQGQCARSTNGYFESGGGAYSGPGIMPGEG